jgi:single-strand DNA-binding protein
MTTNITVLEGRLTKDPSYEMTTNDNPVTKFNLAVEENYKNNSGEKNVNFFRIVAYRERATTLATYLKKGSHVVVTGKLTSRTYDKDGHKMYVVEVIASNVSFISTPENKAQNSQAIPVHEETTTPPLSDEDLSLFKGQTTTVNPELTTDENPF